MTLTEKSGVMAINPQVGAFCINLAQETDRRAHMERQADQLGLPIAFVAAIHGSDLDADWSVYGYAEHRARVTKEIMPANEIACFLSHREALRRFLASPFRYGLVLEDDVAIDQDRLAAALRALPWVDERLGDWDILRLEGPAHARRRRLYRHGDVALACCIKYTSGALANLYSRAGAARTLAATHAFWLPYDIQIGRTWESGLSIFELVPFAITHGDFPSTIGHVGKPKWPRPTLGAKLRHVRWQLHGETARRVMFIGQCLHPLRRALIGVAPAPLAEQG